MQVDTVNSHRNRIFDCAADIKTPEQKLLKTAETKQQQTDNKKKARYHMLHFTCTLKIRIA